MAINSNLVGEVVANAALEAFVNYLTPVANAFATDFSSEGVYRNQVVNVPIYNNYTAGTFAGDYTTGASNDVGAAVVTINKHLFKTVSLTDLEVANNGAGATRAEKFGYQLGEALALGVFQDVLSLVTNANYGAAAFTGTSVGFDADDVVTIKAACDAAKMPLTGRNLVLSSAYYNELLKDDSIKDASAYGGTDAIQGGLLRRLHGFGVWQSTAIPNNSENLVGLAAVPDAIAMAMRYLAPQEGHKYSVAAPITHAPTGLTLGQRQWYDESKGTNYLTIEANYGYAVGIAAGLKRIVSA